MNIVIIANFPDTLDGKNKGRFVYLAELFQARGHQVRLIISDFDHRLKKRRSFIPNGYNVEFVSLHEPGYEKNVSIQRIHSHYCWGKNVEKYLIEQKCIDVIYSAVPSLTAAYKAAVFAKKNSLKFVVDLQDLWPEAFAMAIKNSFLQKFLLPMKWYADKVYSSADLAVAVSDTYINRILEVNKNLHEGVSVFLGNDGEQFGKGRKEFHLDRNKEEYVIGYIGNMSTSYDIPLIFDALAEVKKRGHVGKPIRFVLIGGGVDEEKFKKYAMNTYNNYTFCGKKSYQEMAGMLCDCDLVVNPIVKGSVASIINKVGDYALSGVPVINTQESQEYRQLIEEYGCGVNCRCGNMDDVANAIEALLKDSELRDEMKKGAQKLGRERFDRRYTYHIIVDAVEKLVD